MKSLAIINASAPFGSINFRESLDMALANASYDRPIALFFYGDGVFQIINGTDGTLCGQKELGKTFGLLDMYDVEDIFICEASLIERNMSLEDLTIDVQCLASQAWFEKVSQFDQVLTF